MQEIQVYEKAIESNPNDFDAYFNLGKALSGQGKLDQAIAAYQQAIDIDPNRPGVYGFLGNIYLRKGNFDEAIAAYKKAFELNPKQPAGVYRNLGKAHFKVGNMQEAVIAYRTATELDPKQPAEVYKNLEIALKQLGNDQKSNVANEEANQLQSNTSETEQVNALSKYKGLFSEKFDEVVYGDYFTLTPEQLDELVYEDISDDIKKAHLKNIYINREFGSKENDLLEQCLSDDQKFYRENGFLIKNNLIPEVLIDEYLELRKKLNLGSNEFASVTDYNKCPEMRRIACYRLLTEILCELHSAEMGLIFTLTKFKTTQRGWHQDAYLDHEDALPRVATWIALGDIHPDSGPFELIPKSHRWNALSNLKINKYLKPEYHWPEAQRKVKPGVLPWGRISEAFVDPIVHKKIHSEEHKVHKFIAKKGDVLIWYGRLMHRGAPAKNKDLIRPVLIGHYAPIFERDRGLFLRDSNKSYFLVPPNKYEDVKLT